MFTLRRSAARAILLDDQHRVFLMQSQDPGDPAKGLWWELPGGGIHRGESSAAAAARELREETGYTAVTVGPVVWQRHTTFTFSGMLFDQDEAIHVAHLDPAGVLADTALESLELLAFVGSRWWTAAAVAASSEQFFPTRLPELLPAVIADDVAGRWSGPVPPAPVLIGD